MCKGGGCAKDYIYHRIQNHSGPSASCHGPRAAQALCVCDCCSHAVILLWAPGQGLPHATQTIRTSSFGMASIGIRHATQHISLDRLRACGVLIPPTAQWRPHHMYKTGGQGSSVQMIEIALTLTIYSTGSCHTCSAMISSYLVDVVMVQSGSAGLTV